MASGALAEKIINRRYLFYSPALNILIRFTNELHGCRVTQDFNSISKRFEILTPDHICPDFFNLLIDLFNSDTGAHDCTWITGIISIRNIAPASVHSFKLSMEFFVPERSTTSYEP